MMLSLVDESFDATAIAAGAKLKCLLFAREAALLPTIRRVGDIVRMHRLKVNMRPWDRFNNTTIYSSETIATFFI